MKERLQKIISARGVTSRRRAEELIAAGEVLVNGQVATLGQQADPDIDIIVVSGQALPVRSELVYLMLNKPRGIVTTLSDEKGRDNVAQLVADCGQRVWPIGRLDMDSEGLLLFTNDGAFGQAVAHPRGEVEKRYLVWVQGFSPEKETLLGRRVTLDGYTIAKPGIRVVHAQGDRARIEVTIHEGRNRQVRRMCAMAGLKVMKLLRISEGGISLGNLPPGSWRYLTPNEIQILRQEGK